MIESLSPDLRDVLDDLLASYPGKATMTVHFDDTGWPSAVVTPVNPEAPELYVEEVSGYYYIQVYERAAGGEMIAGLDPSSDNLDIKTDLREWAAKTLSDIALFGIARYQRFSLGFIPRYPQEIVLDAEDALDRLRGRDHVRVLQVWEPW